MSPLALWELPADRDSEELQGLTVRDHMGTRMWEELSGPGTEKGCPPCSPLLTCAANTDHPNHVSHQEGETDPVFGSQASFSGLRSGGLSPPSGNPVQGHAAPRGKKKQHETHLKLTQHLRAKPSPATSPCSGCHVASGSLLPHLPQHHCADPGVAVFWCCD